MARPTVVKIGDRYGFLTVTNRVQNVNLRQSRWICECDCGQDTQVYGHHLRTGNVRSCGCNRLAAMALANSTHGLTQSRTYHSWNMMKQRCRNPKAKDYKKYGGRGITVCDRWSTFTNFLADMGLRPDDATLDRIDNDGSYTPDNCRWATGIEQQANRAVTQMLSFDCETKPLSEWARDADLPYKTVYMRLTRYGWTPAQALGREPR